MSKKIQATIAGLTLVLAACSSGEAGAGADSVELSMGTPFPASHVIQANVFDDWVQEVNEASDGTISIDIVPSEALAPADALYENTVSGAQEIGWSLQGYTAGRFPITQLIQTPLTFTNAEQATEVLWDLLEEFPEFKSEYEDVHILALWTTDTGHIWTKDGAATDDLSGVTLRSPGPSENVFITQLGATPVGMPAPEMYDAMERGVIDGVLLPYSGLESFNLLELVGSGIECNCYTSAHFTVMNKETWEGLNDDQRAVMEDLTGRELSLKAARAYDEHTTKVREKAQEAGINIEQLGAPLPENWVAARDAAAADIVSDIDAANAPGQEMLDRLFELAGDEK
jgi:TRAP-type C4-dicarboxylate transport system substrate-binding protein